MSRVVLASFDVVPSPKGASAHILSNARILAEHHHVSLVTLGSMPVDAYPHRTVHLREPNWLRRGVAFEQRVADVFADTEFDVYHVRSPWEGLAVPLGKPLVYEVNALYSIEVGYHYPATAARGALRSKLRARELCLLDRSSLVVTPSPVTAAYLTDLGVDATRIRVVPNAPSVEPSTHEHHRDGTSEEAPVRLCYVGTVAPWQGLPEIVSVLGRLDTAFELSIVATGPSRRRKWIDKLVRKKGLASRVRLVEPMSKAELGAFLATQDIGLAPLVPSERNLVQGCNPIKILDYCAAGVAVLAPDMPVVRDIVGEQYPLYSRWKRSAAVALLASLIGEPAMRSKLAVQGAARVVESFSRDHQRDRLLRVYEELVG